jgi:hypothetical protein
MCLVPSFFLFRAPRMTWKDLLKDQRVKAHRTSHKELHDLRAVVQRDLKDAKLDQLSRTGRIPCRRAIPRAPSLCRTPPRTARLARNPWLLQFFLQPLTECGQSGYLAVYSALFDEIRQDAIGQDRKGTCSPIMPAAKVHTTRCRWTTRQVPIRWTWLSRIS